MRTYRLLMVALIGGLLATLAMADELTLVDIIEFPIENAGDTISIRSIMPVADFNNDNYNDLLIGYQRKINGDYLEVAYLYYGGPAFDIYPDLLFNGDHNYGDCYDYTAYGAAIADLGDFNNDGYNDIAISACAMCADDTYNGRIYFYYGSPNPDTIPDLIIDGSQEYDGFGYNIYGGDYNGDGIGDILTMTIDQYYGQKVYIYAGSSNPDDDYDFIADYSYQETYISDLFGGGDINGDGYDDFGWTKDYESTYLFWGDTNLNEEPDYMFSGYGGVIGDISNDGSDDFIKYDGNGVYLCLGDSPFDTIPDYYLWDGYTYDAFVCNIATDMAALIKVDDNNNRLLLYNIGVPFDTIPFGYYNFYRDRMYKYDINIGDINYDGLNEFAFIYRDDSLSNRIYIYSIGTVGIKNDTNNALPKENNLLAFYPNPFNSSTIISYSNIEGGELRIFDIAGRLVKTLACESNQGNVVWDGTNMSGEKLSSGVYFVKAAKGEHGVTAKLVYLK